MSINMKRNLIAGMLGFLNGLIVAMQDMPLYAILAIMFINSVVISWFMVYKLYAKE